MAQPPPVLFDSMADDPEAVCLGAKLNQAYAIALRQGRRGEVEDGLEWAKVAMMNYWAHFPPERRGAILRGAWVSVYGVKEKEGLDTAVWLAQPKEMDNETRSVMGRTSVANLTIQSLREIDLLATWPDPVLPATIHLPNGQSDIDDGTCLS